MTIKDLESIAEFLPTNILMGSRGSVLAFSFASSSAKGSFAALAVTSSNTFASTFSTR